MLPAPSDCSCCKTALPPPTIQLGSGGESIAVQPNTYRTYRIQLGAPTAAAPSGVVAFTVCDTCASTLGTAAPVGW